jgi:folate-binding protein YgfZ
MGIIRLDAYVLLISGHDRYSFLDGLSTNKVDSSCSTVLTTTSAKIIDVLDVIEVGENLAVVGYEPYKETVLNHLQPRILQQDVMIRDITSINNVYVSTEKPYPQEGVTISQSYLGWIIVASIKNPLQETMSNVEFTDYRTRNLIPYPEFEITPNVHPFNCGLHHLVHEAKGCYIGQEVLTRMRSRDKMGKQLVQVPSDAEDATSQGTEFALAIRRV